MPSQLSRHRISPRLARLLLLAAFVCATVYVAFISFHHVQDSADDDLLTILPIDHPPDEPYAPPPAPPSAPALPPAPPAPVPPWLPNPHRPPLNFSNALLKPGEKYMHTDVIASLRRAPAPSSNRCRADDAFGPLLLVGVFSTAGAWRQRSVLRTLQARGANARSPPVEFVFVLGRGNVSREMRMAEMEREMFGDVVVLDVEENMDDGKTYAFFRWAAQRPEGARPRFVMKADEDTLLILPNVLHSFATLDCAANIYWGTFWGSCVECFPLYMRGMAYALSWPLVRWVGAGNGSALAANDTRGIEDIRTAGWMGSLPPGELVHIVDWRTHMGDWYGGTIPHDVHTVALHAMKTPEFWIEIAQEMVGIWKREGWEYTWPPL